MDELLEKALLYDFYGELLTDHQKDIYEDAVFEDLGYTEIGETYGVSRQCVYESVKRISGILHGYEEKLHLVERFMKTQDDVAKIRELAKSLKKTQSDETINEIIKIADDILANS